VPLFFTLGGSSLKAVGPNLLLLKTSRHLSVLLCDNLKIVFKIRQGCKPIGYDAIKNNVEVLAASQNLTEKTRWPQRGFIPLSFRY